MTAFQTLLKMRVRRVNNGKNPLPIEILRAFQNERKVTGERVAKMVEMGILKEIKKGVE